MESLLPKVSQYFPNYGQSAVKNILLLSLCLLEGRTVNLYKLRGYVSRFRDKPIQPSSGYKSLIRIFDSFAYSRLWIDLLLYGFRLLRLKSDYLTMDGTSWKRHGVYRHYLTLAVIYNKIAIPIFWIDLGKKGISNTQERKKLIRRALRFFDLKGMTLLADREYIGAEWFKYLVDNNLEFTIRLRRKDYQKAFDASSGLSYQKMIRKVERSAIRNKAMGKLVELEGRTYQLVVSKYQDHKGKVHLLLLLSSHQGKAQKIADSYRLRWKLECTFKHLKSNGFDMEQINLQGSARSDLMMAVTVFTYVLSIHEGLKTYKKVRTVLRKDGTIEKTESVFRHGLDRLIALMASIGIFYHYLFHEVEQVKVKYRSNKWVNV